MAPRLEHEQSTQMVEVIPGVPPLVEDGVAGDRREPGYDDPNRLPPGVHLDSTDGSHGHGERLGK
jgi:hypothetical protein